MSDAIVNASSLRARSVPQAATRAIVTAVALVFPFIAHPYWVHVGALAWYYALLTASWSLLAGYAGQFSFAHVAFAALGGYASVLLVQQAHLPPPVSVVLTIVLVAAVGAGVGWLVLRLSGPYLALFTLALSEIFRLVLTAETQLTRGSQGLEVTGFFPSADDRWYYYAGLLLLVGALSGMHGLLRSRIGLFLRAIREDEDAAKASGVDTTRCKILVFVITAAIAAIAGIYYGQFVGILAPTMTILPEMGLVVAMAVVGGVESLPGAAAGAVLVTVLSELMRDAGAWRFALLGLALILIQRFAQNGLYAPIARLFRRGGP